MFLTKDIYLYMCEFLHTGEIVILTTLCKTYMERYYKHIWYLIHNRYFARSIIPKTEYLTIRNNLAISMWWWADHHMRNSCNKILTLDNIIKTQMSELKYLNPDTVDYDFINEIILDKIQNCKEDRDEILLDLKPHILKFLDNFRFISMIDDDGEFYYTIKQELDPRLYGYDIKKEEDLIAWEIKLKSIMVWSNYEYDFDPTELDDDYVYGYDSDHNYYRIRKHVDYYGG